MTPGAVQLESSHSCLSPSSEQNNPFKQDLPCLFPGHFTDGKAIYVFPLLNIQIIEKGFWLQRLLEIIESFTLRFSRRNITRRGAAWPPFLVPVNIRSLLHYTQNNKTAHVCASTCRFGENLSIHSLPQSLQNFVPATFWRLLLRDYKD